MWWRKDDAAYSLLGHELADRSQNAAGRRATPDLPENEDADREETYQPVKAAIYQSRKSQRARIIFLTFIGLVALLLVAFSLSEWFEVTDTVKLDAILEKLGLQQISKLPLADSACRTIPEPILKSLQASGEKKIAIVSRGRLVDGALSAPASICVLVNIPQSPPVNTTFDGDYNDRPVPGKGPDLIHLLGTSPDVALTFPPLLPLPDHQEYAGSILYHAETDLLHNGTYNFTATQEFKNWRWAQEWHISLETHEFLLDSGVPPDGVFAVHEYFPETLPSAFVQVDGINKLPRKPRCNDKVTAAHGRWYRGDAFPSIDPDTVDESGYSWQGDYCTLDHFTPNDVMDCLKDKVIHIYGDSMTRRETKAILNGGDWCRNVTNKCQDEDDRKDVPNTKLDIDAQGNTVVTTLDGVNDDHFGHDQINHIDFGKNTSIYFQFVTTITNQTSLWMKLFYDDDDLIKPQLDPENKIPPDFELKPNAKPRLPPNMPKPDAILLGFGAHDQAFTDRFDRYEERLIQFREAFLGAYEDVPIVMRLANSWCCRSTHTGFRRYNGGRVQEMDHRTRKVFGIGNHGHSADGRIRVFDPVNMNGRAEIIFNWGVSDANHPRASHVRTEVQMQFHSLCERDPLTRKMRLREGI